MKRVMRAAMIAAVLAAAVTEPLTAESKVSPFALPVFPGGQVTLEANATNEDVLPIIKQIISQIKFGATVKGEDKTTETSLDVAKMLEDVKAVSVQEVKIEVKINDKRTAKDLVDFFEVLPSKSGMTRILFMENDNFEQTRVYTGPKGDGMYAFMIFPKPAGMMPPQYWVVRSARLVGKVNVDQKALMEAFQMWTQAKPKPAPAPAPDDK